MCDVNTNTCKPCSIDADCALIAGKGVCDAGTCVQCTGKKYEACGKLESTAVVCDSAAKTCTTDKKEHSAGPCQPCVSDAQCKAGQLCAKQMYKDKLVGNFCFWKQGDTANGAPAACFTEANRPYVRVEADVTSVDGDSATLCTLASVTTCVAVNQYRTKDCAPTGTPDPNLCGFAPGADANCVETSTGSKTYRCTNVCLSADDCKGSGGGSSITCDVNATPNVCTLQ
ncbi:MAG: hypothetical protein QM784_21940 [Polyangiaceae bacterium]